MIFCSNVFAIANYTLPSNVLLAPMAGVTDTPWRLLCQEWGAGLTSSEMLIANSAHWDTEKSRLRVSKPTASQVPHSVQIVGSEPDMMAESAKQAMAYGADIIDINMGCPAKKVCKKAAGSALLKDEALVEKILLAVTSAVSVPVTLKIRTGWDDTNKNAKRIAKIAQQSGIQALAIHGRTRACRFVGEVEYETIAEVKSAVTIPVIANGDIDSIEKALWVKNYTQADALMIGRGVQGRPWFFQQVIAALKGEEAYEPSYSEKLTIIADHIKALHQFYGERKGLGFARKHMGFYLEQLAVGERKADFNRLPDTETQLQFIDALRDDFVKGNVA